MYQIKTIVFPQNYPSEEVSLKSLSYNMSQLFSLEIQSSGLPEMISNCAGFWCWKEIQT